MTMTPQEQSTGLHVSIAVSQRNVDLAFSVPAGETLALVGANGAGKTTTLMALAGWLIPDTGRAQLNDITLFNCPDATSKPTAWVPARQRGVGLLSQNHLLFPHISSLQNIMYGMVRAGITGRAARKMKAEQWLQRVGLAGYGKRKPGQLSGGQAQRVAIARVLASSPNLVLLDEPLAALDAAAAPAIRQLLCEVLADRTVVLVTHHQEDVDGLADHIYRIDAPPSASIEP